MGYSIELRIRALEYWEEGHTKEETAKVFKVSTSILQKWKYRLKETGKLENRKREITSPKIDLEKLKNYIDEHPDKFQYEVAEKFGCSQPCICKALKRLKITRKKRS